MADLTLRVDARRPDVSDEQRIRNLERAGQMRVTEWELVSCARQLDRKSRGENLFRYTQNGSVQRVRSCRLCGASTSWCGRWPRTRESIEAEQEHVLYHETEATLFDGDVQAYVQKIVTENADNL